MAEGLSALAIELGLSAEGVEAGFAKVKGSAETMANRVGRELDKMQLGLINLGKTAAQVDLNTTIQKFNQNGATEQQRNEAAKMHQQRVDAERVQSINGIVAALEKEANALGKTAGQLKIEELRAKGATAAQLKHAEALNKKIGSYNKANGGASKYLATLKGFAGVAIGAMGVQSLIKASDEWTGISNKLKLVTKDSKELASVQKELVSIATSSGQSLGATADLYSKLAQAQNTLGLSQKEMLTLTDSVSKAMALSGASTSEAERAIVQFSQGLSKGKFDMQDMKSIIEQSPALAQYIADGMGVSVGKLRDLISQGKLTAEATVEALQKTRGQIVEDAKSIDLTISQSLENVKTKFTEFIGQTGKASGTVKMLSGAIQVLANNIDLIVGAIGTLVAIKLVKWVTLATIEIGKQTIAIGLNTAAYVLNAKAATAAALAQARFNKASLAGGVAKGVATGKVAQGVASGVAATATSSGIVSTIGTVAVALSRFIVPLALVTTAMYALYKAYQSYKDGTLKEVFFNKEGKNEGVYNTLTGTTYRANQRRKKREAEEAEALEKENETKKANITGALDALGNLQAELDKQVNDFGKTTTELQKEEALRLVLEAKKNGATEDQIQSMNSVVESINNSQAQLQKLEVDGIVEDLNKQRMELGKTGEELLRLQLKAKGVSDTEINRAAVAHQLLDSEKKRLTVSQMLEMAQKKVDDFGKSQLQLDLDQLAKNGATPEQMEQYKKLVDTAEGMQTAADLYKNSTDSMGGAAQTFKEGVDLWSKSAEFRAGFNNQQTKEAGLPTYSQLGVSVKDLDKTIKETATTHAKQIEQIRMDHINKMVGNLNNKEKNDAMNNAVENVDKNTLDNKKDMGSLEIKLMDGAKSMAGKIFGEEEFVGGLKQFFEGFIHENARAIEN